MASIIHNKQIIRGIVFLEEIAGHGRQLDLGGVRGDEPNFGGEAVEKGEDVVEGVEFFFHLELVFGPLLSFRIG